MDCLFFGSSEKAFFNFEDIHKCRTLVKPFYPTDVLEYISGKTKGKKDIASKQSGEIRIIGADVAMMGEITAPHIRNYMMKNGVLSEEAEMLTRTEG